MFQNKNNCHKFVQELIKKLKIRNYDQNYRRSHILYLQFVIGKIQIEKAIGLFATFKPETPFFFKMRIGLSIKCTKGSER